jgi:hypothetical protein
MAVYGWKTIIGLGMSLAIAACDKDPTSPAQIPDAVVQKDVRFQAIAAVGTKPLEVTIDVQMVNTSTSSRYLAWGGCGIGLRLYRSGSLVYQSHNTSDGVCDAVLHTAAISAAQVRQLKESIILNGTLVHAGYYHVTVVFQGRIDDSDVEIEVSAGTIEL